MPSCNNYLYYWVIFANFSLNLKQLSRGSSGIQHQQVLFFLNLFHTESYSQKSEWDWAELMCALLMVCGSTKESWYKWSKNADERKRSEKFSLYYISFMYNLIQESIASTRITAIRVWTDSTINSLMTFPLWWLE